MTYQFSADYAQQNLEQIIQQAQQESGGVIITQGDKKFVLIEQSKLQELQEAEQFDQLTNLFQNVAPIKKEYNQKKTVNLKDMCG
jgi:PHD/YefM family antitoxin component YafN of YafNO toxin-antitoxin module